MKKRFLSTLLALCIVLTLLPSTVFAANNIIASGECGAQGDNLTWTLDGEGLLTISGNGEMAGYQSNQLPTNRQAPWHNYWREIKTVVIEDSVTSIGAHAFSNCQYLSYIAIPASVTTTGDSIFFACFSLTSAGPMGGNYNIEFGWTEEIPSYAFYMSELTSVTIPEGIVSIGDHAFDWCRITADITIPASVTHIGLSAFDLCASQINVANENSAYTSQDGILFSKDMTRLIQYPYWKTDIETYEIPSTVTCIEPRAFGSCKLIEVIIPMSVVNIKNRAFQHSSQLTRITMPYNIMSIEEYAFYGCRSLQSVAIPVSVVSIGGYTFMECDSLEDVYYGGSKNQWSNIGGYNWKTQLTSDTITIHYAAADIIYENSGGMGTMDLDIVEKDTLFTLPPCGFTAPTGKEFKAWSINGVEYAPGSSYTVTDDITITATWKDIDTPITPPEVPDKYIVSYDANGGTGTMDSDIVEKGTPFALPACGFTAPADKEFKAWQISNTEYNPNDVYTVTADTTVTAVWQTIPIVGYTLTGTITGHKGVTYTSVTAQLVGLNGSTYSAELGAGVVDKTGKTEYAYTVAAPAGQYALEVEARTDTGGVVNRSAVVKLTGNGQTKDINLPNGQSKVKVENKIETAALVGGLDELIIDADGEVNGEVTLTIGSVDNSNPAVATIRNAAPGRTLEFMDISITKSENGVESAVTDTGNVTVEIVLAFDRTGKSDIAVYRYHDGSVDTLTTQSSGNGEKIEVNDDSIAIYAKKFSVYAIGYTVSTADPVTPSNPSAPSYSSNSSYSGPTYSINIPSRITGGTVKVTPTSASAGSKVTITAKPSSGYEVETITVTDKDGKQITVTDAGDGKYTFIMPKSKVDVEVDFVQRQTTPSFTDVQSGAYYANAVAWAVEKGITNGTGDGKFSPDDSCTRAQIVTFLWRAAGSPTVSGNNPFTDVSQGSYYYDAVLWAVAQGITSGTSATTFSPNDTCTRGQAVTFLYRFTGSPAVSGGNSFADVSAAQYYANAVSWAVANGITNGTGNGRFSPNEPCTRAQIVTFLYRDMA